MSSEHLTVKAGSRVITKKSLDYVPNPQGLGHELFYSMLHRPYSIAQIDPETSEFDTYGALLYRCVRTCVNLVLMGITKDDIICQCSGNHFDSCVPILVGLFLGVTVAHLDPGFSLEETTFLISKLRPRLIFTAPETVKNVESALEIVDIACKIILFGESDDYTEFSSLIQPLKNETKFRPLPISSVNETAIIVYSSGTMGVPKGVCLSHYTLMIQMVNTVTCWNLGKELRLTNYMKEVSEEGFRVVMGFESFFWMSAVTIFVASVATGIARVVCKEFRAERIWQDIDRYHVSFLLCTTSQAIQIYDLGKPEAVTGSSLKMLVTTGQSFTRANLLQLRNLFPYCFITHVYEMTEIGGAIAMYSFNKPEDIRDQYEDPTSCGRLIPGLICKIVDPITETLLGVNQPGELRYKCDFLMNGYFRKHSVNADSTGWIRTGDVIVYDEKGRVRLLDSIQDVFRRKCWHVVPSPIENVIKSHPAVKEAVVIGLPDEHEELGENPIAFVRLKRDMKNRVTDNDLKEFANEILSKKQKLAGLRIFRDLPLAANGRPLRQRLRQMALHGVMCVCCDCTRKCK